MTRYVTHRVNGSWQVQDSESHNFVMGEYGSGSSGYKLARVVADQLNDQPKPSKPAPLRPAPAHVSGLRSPAGLLAWRRAHKLTQQGLADLLEVHKLTVLRWEMGQVPIPRTTELALLYLEQTLARSAV
jgi:DNA-binding transcriptional regulator YiaG